MNATKPWIGSALFSPGILSLSSTTVIEIKIPQMYYIALKYSSSSRRWKRKLEAIHNNMQIIFQSEAVKQMAQKSLEILKNVNLMFRGTLKTRCWRCLKWAFNWESESVNREAKKAPGGEKTWKYSHENGKRKTEMLTIHKKYFWLYLRSAFYFKSDVLVSWTRVGFAIWFEQLFVEVVFCLFCCINKFS